MLTGHPCSAGDSLHPVWLERHCEMWIAQATQESQQYIQPKQLTSPDRVVSLHVQEPLSFMLSPNFPMHQVLEIALHAW